MKLLLISRCPPYPLHLGDRLIPYHLARQLSERGDEIDLLAYFNEQSDQRQIGYYARYFRAVHLIREPRRSQRSYLSRLFLPGTFFPRTSASAWSAEMWDRIRTMMATTRYDVVHLFGGIQVYEFRTLVKKLPTIIVPYESYSLYLQRAMQQEDSFAARLQLWAAREYERRMFSGFGRVVVLSEVDAQQMIDLDPKLPLRVIPNGVDLSYFVPQPEPEDSQTLIFFANFEYAPNIDAAHWLVREILPLISAQVPTVQLQLVGNNPPADVRLLENDQVKVTGRVPDLRPYIASAALFISPLRLGAGIKNKMLEAMAMGKAIVATPLSADGIEVVADENVLFGNTAEQLAQQAITLLRNPARRKEMGIVNHALIADRYSWERVADDYEKLYREVLNA
ncbi:MAG: glycosyltransferase [Anaerolineae bacterium]|nr:glycosyltransferase [Anaerolineae bacterium]